MWLSDKITNGKEILEAGEFQLSGCPFYVFLAPKSETAPSIALLQTRLQGGDTPIEFPFVVGAWNPVVCRFLKLTSEDISNYRIWYGTEG